MRQRVVRILLAEKSWSMCSSQVRGWMLVNCVNLGDKSKWMIDCHKWCLGRQVTQMEHLMSLKNYMCYAFCIAFSLLNFLDMFAQCPWSYYFGSMSLLPTSIFCALVSFLWIFLHSIHSFLWRLSLHGTNIYSYKFPNLNPNLECFKTEFMHIPYNIDHFSLKWNPMPIFHTQD